METNKIQEYLRDRGLPTTGNKEELVALAFSASYFFELNLIFLN